MSERARKRGAQEMPPLDPISRREADEIAAAIVGARKRAGMTQVEIATEMGIAQSAIAKLESGRSMPRISTLQRLARATSSRLHVSIDPVSNHDIRTASSTMTDTLSRPGISTDRRHFLGSALSLTGSLGLDNVRHVTAEEATAAVTSADGFVWVAPDWGEEPPLFEVLNRTETSVRVRTGDAEIEIPASPTAIVAAADEYVPLFELGMTGTFVGLGGPTLANAGDLTADMHAKLADVHVFAAPWELDAEEVMDLEPDLIFGNTLYQQDEIYDVLSEVAPFVRTPNRVVDVPRGAIRDFGKLFGLEDKAAALLESYESYVERARETLGTVAEGKRFLLAWAASPEAFDASSAYYLLPDGTMGSIQGAYQLYRELGLTPTSFMEEVAKPGGENIEQFRDGRFFRMSWELFGKIDADYVFVDCYADGDFEVFMSNPAVQTSEAYKNGGIFELRVVEHGAGLTGSRSMVKYMVETVTGQQFG